MIHKNMLISILGISAVIRKNNVHVNVVHVMVEFKWKVSPKNVLVKKNPIKKNDNSANASLKYAIVNTPAVCINCIGIVIP